jgi:hypothetical protein
MSIGGTRWNKNDVLRYKHKLISLEGEMTLLKAYCPFNCLHYEPLSSNKLGCKQTALAHACCKITADYTFT